jgi:TRAP transporter TAXI family solute receptor
MELSRRRALRVLGVVGLIAAVPACSAPFAGTRLRVATGGTQGVYFALGTALAEAWQAALELGAAPAVIATAGSRENIGLLAAGRVDVAFSQLDTAADELASAGPGGPYGLRALARIHDDVVQVVVPASSPITNLAGLRGARVSVGEEGSGVADIAHRLLAVAGLSPSDLRAEELGINDSVTAMREGTLDAFFWSGGLPTDGVTELVRTLPIRLLDLSDVLTAVRSRFPVYTSVTVPARTYGIPVPVHTLFVRNVLLVPAGMAYDLADALTATLFAAQERLARATPAALTIDTRSAIGTQPVPLHPGAERYYRESKVG